MERDMHPVEFIQTHEWEAVVSYLKNKPELMDDKAVQDAVISLVESFQNDHRYYYYFDTLISTTLFLKPRILNFVEKEFVRNIRHLPRAFQEARAQGCSEWANTLMGILESKIDDLKEYGLHKSFSFTSWHGLNEARPLIVREIFLSPEAWKCTFKEVIKTLKYQSYHENVDTLATILENSYLLGLPHVYHSMLDLLTQEEPRIVKLEPFKDALEDLYWRTPFDIALFEHPFYDVTDLFWLDRPLDEISQYLELIHDRCGWEILQFCLYLGIKDSHIEKEPYHGSSLNLNRYKNLLNIFDMMDFYGVILKLEALVLFQSESNDFEAIKKEVKKRALELLHPQNHKE